MSKEFVTQEVQKILKSKDYPAPLNEAMATAWIIANFKGINIKVLDASETSSLCDYHILASTENKVQSHSILDECLSQLVEKEKGPRSLEGKEDGEWVLLDLGDVIVHIFNESSRDIYDLDTLWAHLPSVAIPAEFYYGEGEVAKKPKESAENYF